MKRLQFASVFSDKTGGNTKLQTCDYRESGEFPIIDQGQDFIAGYTNQVDAVASVELPVIIFGDHSRTLKFVDQPFVLGADGTKVLSPRRDGDARFLFHYLRSLEIPSAGYSRHFKFLKEITVPFPLLDEQQGIAAILDKADELRTKRRQALAQLDALPESIFHAMFGSGVPAQSHYPIVKMGDVLDSASYGTSEKADLTGAIPVLRMGNLTYRGQLDFAELKYVPAGQPDKYLLRYGDVLFNRTNSPDLVGKTAVFHGTAPVAYAGYLIRLRTSEHLIPDYLATFMNLPSSKQLLRKMCKSIVGMANINAKEVQSIRLPLPPVELQRTFATRVAAVERSKETHRKHLDELDALFASLQHRAFKGEL